VRLINRAVILTINKHKVGKGFSNSAASGAKIVTNLETKLQMPIAVALLRRGNMWASQEANVAKHSVK